MRDICLAKLVETSIDIEYGTLRLLKIVGVRVVQINHESGRSTAAQRQCCPVSTKSEKKDHEVNFGHWHERCILYHNRRAMENERRDVRYGRI